MQVPNDYRLLLKFIDTYLPVGFEGIPRKDPLLKEVNAMMARNGQYFYSGDILEFKIMYTSDSIIQILGISPSDLNPGNMYSLTHPHDRKRHGIGRAKMIKLSCDLFNNEGTNNLLTTNLRLQHAQGHYVNLLIQAYVFVRTVPKASTYCLCVQTNIDWFGPIKHGYNFYVGKDMSYFRIPDRDLILTGCVFTNREFEILNLIRDGLDSNEIAEKLFLSSHTVDTHRRNILKKSKHHNTSELIMDLQDSGFF